MPVVWLNRLWYPLTLSLLQFQAQKESSPILIPLFEHFILHFAKNLNSLKLVELGVATAREFADPSTSLPFLQTLVPLLPTPPQEKAPEAYVLLTISGAHYSLLLGDLDATKKQIDECMTILDGLSGGKEGADVGVRGAVYRVAGDYYKAKSDYVLYYRTSLLFLSCLPKPLSSSPIPREELVGRAHDLSISALLGESVYNFGELLLHPILSYLEGTNHDWLRQLLFAFNEGSIGKFETLAPYLEREPILQESYSFLRQKICLMSLLESVFNRSSSQRSNMSFMDIASETGLPGDEVEHLVMKSLSLGLIKGTIDQVDMKVKVSWLQPRVLGKREIGEIKRRLGEWEEGIGRVEKSLQSGKEGQVAEVGA
ncbi:hypothetical protein BT69DRAFT_1219398 [Atractiella rhizophila]|nr:hypothetical protein BT69DRAFT_1219398 [Atractiella rhizophila]